MAVYDFRYRMKLTARNRNGSGYIFHNIVAIAREQGTTGDWEEVHGAVKNIFIDADDVQVVLALPTNNEIIIAYRQLLIDNVNTSEIPISGMTASQLQIIHDNNRRATEAVAAFDTFLSSIGQAYEDGVDFNL